MKGLFVELRPTPRTLIYESISASLDVNNNPSNPVINLRSFSFDPKLVSEMGVQYIKGLQSEGVVAMVKHFPDHSDTGTDSHTGLPLVDKSYDELKNLELYPYTAAVEAGADMVMTAHIQFPQIETETYTSMSTGEEINLPATLSKTIITDILRGDYQFDGIVCTDPMIMDANQVSFERVDASVLAMNADIGIILEPMTIASTAQIAEKAVTLVKNEDNTLPLKLGENGKVAYFYAYDNVENTMAFALDRLKKDGVTAEGNCFKGHKAAEYEDEKLIERG